MIAEILNGAKAEPTLMPCSFVVSLSDTALPPAGVFVQYRALFCASVTHFLLFLLLRLYRLVSTPAALPNICTSAITEIIKPLTIMMKNNW